MKRFTVVHLGKVWLIVVGRSWILARRITSQMNMDEHEDAHALSRPRLQVDVGTH